MNQEDSTEKKPHKSGTARDGHRRAGFVWSKSYKSKVNENKKGLFEIGR